MTPTIRITYTVTTPESVEQGDYSEHGWVDDGGLKYPIDHDNPETLKPPDGLYCSPELCEVNDWLSSVDLAVAELFNRGATEPSSHPFSLGTWYSTEPEQDPGTGASTEYSFHLVDFSDAQQVEIYCRMTACKTNEVTA